MNKRYLISLGSLILVFSMLLAACNNETSGEDGGTEEVLTLKIANYFGPGHSHNVALEEKFIPYIEENSDGNIKVEVYPNSQLGSEEEFYNGVRNGTIEMAIVGTIMASDFPKMSVPEWPYLFNSLEHFKNVLTGPIGEEITEGIDTEHGVHALAYGFGGVRAVSGTKPIRSMEDFAGFRLRMPNIPHFIEVGEALGATITPLPISEVFTAFEQGVADGQDNPIPTLRENGWYEVQDYVLESAHMYALNMYIINNELWSENLTADQQKIIQEAADITAEYQWELYEQNLQSDKEFLQENGIEFITPDEDFLEEMQQSVEPIYEQHFEDYPWAEDLVDRINEEAN